MGDTIEVLAGPTETIEVLGEPGEITVCEERAETIELTEGVRGEQGPAGPQGPVGPQGPAGGEVHVHEQAAAAAEWIIDHDLGARPTIVSVMDSAGTVVQGGVVNPSVNRTILSFTAPFSGTARLI